MQHDGELQVHLRAPGCADALLTATGSAHRWGLRDTVRAVRLHDDSGWPDLPTELWAAAGQLLSEMAGLARVRLAGPGDDEPYELPAASWRALAQRLPEGVEEVGVEDLPLEGEVWGALLGLPETVETLRLTRSGPSSVGDLALLLAGAVHEEVEVVVTGPAPEDAPAGGAYEAVRMVRLVLQATQDDDYVPVDVTWKPR